MTPYIEQTQEHFKKDSELWVMPLNIERYGLVWGARWHGG